jgi:iron(III) transport system substrate-binding protein
VNNRNEDTAFAYMKKLRKNIQAYTKSGGGGTVPVGLGQAAGGIFFIVDALFTRQKGYDVQISFPKEGIGSAAECIALVKGNKNTAEAKKLIDWATSSDMQSQLAPAKINFLPANPKVAPDPALAAMLKGANIIEIDDKWAGENRKRIVDRWIAEVLNAG